MSQVTLKRQQGVQFVIGFGEDRHLISDAKPPIGRGQGADSEQLLAAAVTNCLCASLAFSLAKYKNPEVGMHATSTLQALPNADGRLRVSGIEIEIRLAAAKAALRWLDRVLAQYESFCTVTQSVRRAINVTVRIVDSDGEVLSAH